MWAVFLAGLMYALGSFLWRLFIGLGIFALTAVATDSIMHKLSNLIYGRLNSAGSFGGVNLVTTWQYLGVFDLVNIWLAAWIAAFAIKRLKQVAATAAGNGQGAAATKAGK